MRLSIITLSLAIAFSFQASAQSIKLSAGATLELNQNIDMNTKSTMMGTEIEGTTNAKNKVLAKIKSVKDSVMVVVFTIKRIQGSISMMGQNQQFDSDDSSNKSNPAYEAIAGNLNKEEEHTFVNGMLVNDSKKASSSNENAGNLIGGFSVSNTEFASKLFSPIEAKGKAIGFKWPSEEKTEDTSSTSISIYSITKATDTELEITQNTTQKARGTIKAMGMEVKQNTTSIISNVCVYSKTTGLLKKWVSNNLTNGTAEMMGTNVPINMKITSTATVE